MSQTTMIAMLEEAEDVLRRAGCDMTADKVRGVLQAQRVEPVNKQLLAAVKHSHGIFDQYVSHHLAKPDFDKAAANERHRAICAEAIAAAEQAQQAEPVAYLKTAASVMQLSFEGRPFVNAGADVEVQADTVQPLYAHPPAVAVAVPDEVAKDAARYRWLRQDESEFSSMTPAELDAAIDKAIAAAQKGGA